MLTFRGFSQLPQENVEMVKQIRPVPTFSTSFPIDNIPVVRRYVTLNTSQPIRVLACSDVIVCRTQIASLAANLGCAKR
jgi:hypothetical protein